jgi:hypothetical protein
MLFEVNRDLILDHYRHTNNDMEAAHHLIETFYNLYFRGDTDFSGPRHADSNEAVRKHLHV